MTLGSAEVGSVARPRRPREVQAEADEPLYLTLTADDLVEKHSEDEPRDEHGRWTESSSGDPISEGLRARIAGTRVADAGGNPARVYHGSPRSFEEMA